MFTLNHFIWIAVCVLLIVAGVIFIKRYKPTFSQVINYACITCVLSELVKVFSTVKMIPRLDGNGLYPYLELNHLPLHLCSLQILFIFYLKLNKEDNIFKKWLLAFMYPSCILGGIMALAMPSIFNTTISASQAFTHPIAYQTFLFHTMLILLGIYIYMSPEVSLQADGYKKSMIVVFVLGFISIYLNSMFSTPIYDNGILVGVNHTTNFFFSMLPPLPIPFTNRIHWYLYVLIILVLAAILIGLLYIPVFRRNGRKYRLKVKI